jgi:hypothetical protein
VKFRFREVFLRDELAPGNSSVHRQRTRISSRDSSARLDRGLHLFGYEGRQGGKVVRLFIRLLLIVWSSGNLLGAFAQDTTSRSGFAVVTPLSGNVAGLIASETLKNQTSSGVEHAIIAPSALITSASILVPVGPVAENTTAIAIANPSLGSGGVNLVLTDKLGSVVLNVTVHLGPRGQFSKFLNEFFPTPPAAFTTPLLLTVSSEIPVAIVALNFRGAEFTSIPLTSLSPPTAVAIQPVTPPPPATASTGFGLGLATMPNPVAVPPVTPPPIPTATFSPPVTVSSSPAPTTATIGGGGSLVFPQVATGGVWSTEIALGNTSSGEQSVRIDFFRSDGVETNSLTDVVIPPRGVVFLSASGG